MGIKGDNLKYLLMNDKPVYWIEWNVESESETHRMRFDIKDGDTMLRILEAIEEDGKRS